MTIALRGLKVKVMGQAYAVGLTSIEGSFFPVINCIHNDMKNDKQKKQMQH